MILANQLTKKFGDEIAVVEASFAIEKGEFVTFVGPSGCGKSTILKTLAGLQTPTSGELEVESQSTAFVFQEPNLLPWRTAIDNVTLPLEIVKHPSRNESKPVRLEKARAALRKVGLVSTDDKKIPRELSGGMRMRVSLARALVTEPQLMLMDEPFAALDDVLRIQLNEELLSLWQENDWTTVFVTHNVHEAVFLSQRILVMGTNPGRIVSEVAIPFDYPRKFQLQSSPQFTEIVHEVTRQLRESSSSE